MPTRPLVVKPHRVERNSQPRELTGKCVSARTKLASMSMEQFLQRANSHHPGVIVRVRRIQQSENQRQGCLAAGIHCSVHREIRADGRLLQPRSLKLLALCPTAGGQPLVLPPALYQLRRIASIRHENQYAAPENAGYRGWRSPGRRHQDGLCR